MNYVYLSCMVLLNRGVEWLFAVIQQRDINSKQVGYEVRNSVISCSVLSQLLVLCMFTASQVTTLEKDRNVNIITFRVSRRRRESREMYIGHARLSACVSVCLSVRRRMPTLLHGPGCHLGEW